MATDLGQVKSPPTAKYETFVKDQLARAESRIRTLDLTAALLAFAGWTLAYAVAVALLDRLLELPPGVRQGACVVYLLASLVYLTLKVFVPLSRRINPYFAARQLERSLPGAKNSVVNWLDLHGENLPSAIRGAVGQRAAHDLGRADLEKAVSARRAYWAGGVAALWGLAFLIALFILGPGLFFAHLGRTFAPFGGNGAAAVPTGTQITVVKPADGDAVVPDARPVDISVRVDGRVPDTRAADALRLLYHYQQTAPYISRPLDKDDNGRWGTTLAPNEVADGFWYKVAGGDAETPEYQVRLTPRLSDFKALYTFRPYLARVNETRLERKVEAIRGTQVEVTFHANRDLKEGYLQIDGPNGVASVVRGEVLPEDADGFHARLTLDESGQYRIGFTSVEGETFLETEPAPLIAVPDNAPVVTLTKPAELKEKPGWVSPLQADALLSLEANVTDDIGVAAIRLNMKVENGPTLPAQEYRSREKLTLPHGGNPKDVHYEDFVDLAKVKTSDPLFKIRPGMVLEYWVTAEDACDYPKPNVGESKHYKVQIAEPMNNDQAKKDQQQKADQQKQENDKQQDANNQKEDAKNQQKNEETEKKNGENGEGGKQGDNKNKKPGEGGGEKKPDDKDGKPGDTGSGKPDDKPNQQPNNDDKTKPENPQNGKGDVSKDLDQALKDQQKDQQGTGKNDDRQQPAGDAKGAGVKPKDQPADAKPGPQDKPGDGHDESAAKDQGKPDANQPKQGEGKAGGDSKTQPDAKPGENKQGGDAKAQPEAQPGQGKENKPDASAQPGDAKGGGKPEEQKAAGNDKPQDGPSGDKGATAEKKEGSSPDASADGRPAGEAKDKAAPETKAEAKGGGPQKPDDKDGAKSEAKGDGPKPATGDEKPGDSAKSEGPKTDGQNVAQRKSSGGEGEPEPEEMKPQDVADLAKDLKSNDPKKREAAEKKLREAAANARDGQAREDAKKDLEGTGLKPSEDVKVAEGKPKEGPGGPDGMPPDNKDKEKPSEAKGGMGEPSQTAKDTPKAKPGDDMAKGETKGDGKPSDKTGMGESKATPPGEAKGGPGNGAKERHDEPRTADNTPAPPVTPEKPVEQKASVLQLRKFLDTVDKKALEDAKRDPAAMKRLQDEARKWLAAHPPEGDETPTGPQQGGALGSVAGRKSNPNDKAATDDSDVGGRPLPPPGYRDPYKEFTKLLSPGGDK